MNELNYPAEYLGQFDSNGYLNCFNGEESGRVQRTLNLLAGQFIAHAGLPDNYASRVAINSIFLAESNFVQSGGPMQSGFDPSFYMGIGTALNALRSTVTGTLQTHDHDGAGQDIIAMMHSVIGAHFEQDIIMEEGGDC